MCGNPWRITGQHWVPGTSKELILSTPDGSQPPMGVKKMVGPGFVEEISVGEFKGLWLTDIDYS